MQFRLCYQNYNIQITPDIYILNRRAATNYEHFLIAILMYFSSVLESELSSYKKKKTISQPLIHSKIMPSVFLLSYCLMCMSCRAVIEQPPTQISIFPPSITYSISGKTKHQQLQVNGNSVPFGFHPSCAPTSQLEFSALFF